MSAINDGGPAFPWPAADHLQIGISLRDYFAGQALAGLLADPNSSGDVNANTLCAYDYADAMLAARERRKEGQQ